MILGSLIVLCHMCIYDNLGTGTHIAYSALAAQRAGGIVSAAHARSSRGNHSERRSQHARHAHDVARLQNRLGHQVVKILVIQGSVCPTELNRGSVIEATILKEDTGPLPTAVSLFGLSTRLSSDGPSRNDWSTSKPIQSTRLSASSIPQFTLSKPG